MIRSEIVILSTCIGMLMTAQSQTFSSRVFEEVGIDQRLNDQVPLDLVFRDEEGHSVTLGSYFQSKPVILSLVYYECPMLCTEILNGMVESFRKLNFTVGNELSVISVSINPKETSALAAKKKQHYLLSYARTGSEKGWHFLTGDETSIRALAKAVGFRYMYDEKTGQYAHGSGIMIVTPEGKLARYFFGIEYPAKDLRFALMEASRNKIGSPVDKLMLLCYHYDPLTGKYGLIIANVLRIAGGLTVLVLGGFIFIMFKRDRQKSLEAAKS